MRSPNGKVSTSTHQLATDVVRNYTDPLAWLAWAGKSVVDGSMEHKDAGSKQSAGKLKASEDALHKLELEHEALEELYARCGPPGEAPPVEEPELAAGPKKPKQAVAGGQRDGGHFEMPRAFKRFLKVCTTVCRLSQLFACLNYCLPCSLN